MPFLEHVEKVAFPYEILHFWTFSIISGTFTYCFFKLSVGAFCSFPYVKLSISRLRLWKNPYVKVSLWRCLTQKVHQKSKENHSVFWDSRKWLVFGSERNGFKTLHLCRFWARGGVLFEKFRKHYLFHSFFGHLGAVWVAKRGAKPKENAHFRFRNLQNR